MDKQMNLHIDVNKLKRVVCPVCLNELFSIEFRLREVPRFMVKNPEPGINLIQIAAYICRSCGNELTFEDKGK